MKIHTCPLCRNTVFTKQFIIEGFTIVRCQTCTFVFVLNVPAKSKLDDFYHNKDIHDPESTENIIRIDARRSLKIIEQFTGSRDLFDVGCGRGYFMDEASRRAWDVSGIDYSRSVVGYAKGNTTLKIYHGDILTYHSKRKYSVISLNQVIEHFSDPEKLVRACQKFLKENGILYIATPNIESLSSMLYKEKFDYIIPPEHLSYFSARSLVNLLNKLGFETIFTGTWSYSSEFAGIIKYFIKQSRGKEQKKNLVVKPLNSDQVKNLSQLRQKGKIKSLKKLLFDDIFCHSFHSSLDILKKGSMVHLIAQKK